MFYLLGKNFNRQHLEIFFFYFSKKTDFCHFMQIVSLGKNCLECQRLFSEREKKRKKKNKVVKVSGELRKIFT